jgi:hypothetical protein
MRKHLYQITMKIFPVYFTAIVIAVVIFALFFTVPKVHAQTNHTHFHSVLASVPLNNFQSDQATINEDKIIIPDDAPTKIEIVNHNHDQYVEVYVNRNITNIIIFDDHNQVMEDIYINKENHQVDTSSLCPGIYYIRVDYTNGSSLRPLVIQ